MIYHYLLKTTMYKFVEISDLKSNEIKSTANKVVDVVLSKMFHVKQSSCYRTRNQLARSV